MNFLITPNGHLKLYIDLSNPEDIDAVSDCHSIEDIIGTHFMPNGHLEMLLPEEIAALTDSPIIAKDTLRTEMGELVKADHIWWFPQYESTDPMETLRETGEVIFTKA